MEPDRAHRPESSEAADAETSLSQADNGESEDDLPDVRLVSAREVQASTVREVGEIASGRRSAKGKVESKLGSAELWRQDASTRPSRGRSSSWQGSAGPGTTTPHHLFTLPGESISGDLPHPDIGALGELGEARVDPPPGGRDDSGPQGATPAPRPPAEFGTPLAGVGPEASASAADPTPAPREEHSGEQGIRPGEAHARPLTGVGGQATSAQQAPTSAVPPISSAVVLAPIQAPAAHAADSAGPTDSGPRIRIGRVDVIVETAARPEQRSDPQGLDATDLASRLYLRNI